MALNFLEAYERVKMEEYKIHYKKNGFTEIEDREFDLVVRKEKLTIVFEFKLKRNFKIEELQNRAKNKYPNSRFELVICLPKLETPKSIKIDWLKEHLNYTLEKEKLDEISKKIVGFIRISGVNSIETTELEWKNKEVVLSGYGYFLYWVKVRNDSIKGEIITDPLKFEYTVKLNSTAIDNLYISNLNAKTEIEIIYESFN